MSWFVEGNDLSRDKFIKDAYRPSVINFWLKDGETREVVFIDDARFGCYEHVVPLNGSYKNFTCSGSDCVLCGMEKNRSYREYYSILDLTPYKDKNGKEHKFSRKALAATKDVAAILQSRRSDSGGTLLGKKFRVSRSGSKSPSCGNDWVFQSAVDLNKVPSEIKAYDFRETLRPRPAQEIQAILNFGGPTESAPTKTYSRSALLNQASEQGNAAEDSDIPF